MSNITTIVFFIVKGTVKLSGEFFDRSGYVIRAFDRDIRTEEPLGDAVTNIEGEYQINFKAEQFRRAEKTTADLVLRIYNAAGALLEGEMTLDGQPLDPPRIIYNAPLVATVDFIDPVPVPVPELSEYERLLVVLEPALEELPLAELTDADLEFLVGELGGREARERKAFAHELNVLRQAARLSREAELLVEACYAWGRQGISLVLGELLAHSNGELVQALRIAFEKNIIPPRLAAALEQILRRLDQLRGEQAFRDEQKRVPVEVIVRLVSRDTDAPLAGWAVRTMDLDRGGRDLGLESTDGRGLFTFVYTVAPDEPPAEVGQSFRFVILDSQGDPIHQEDVRVQGALREVLTLAIPLPPLQEPVSPTIDDVGVEVPENLRGALAAHGIHSLSDIRKAGGLHHLLTPDLATDARALALEAHADLGRVSSNVEVNSALIAQGYTRTADVAKASRAQIVGLAYPHVGDFKPAKSQVLARAQTRFLNNVLFDYQANQANGTAPAPELAQIMAPSPSLCQCKDCEAAVSPIAYLVDLLDYAVDHVRNAGAAIALPFLADEFQQPFGELAGSCSEADEQVRQVRICVEVLRKYLRANPPDPAQLDVLSQAERRYRLEAYAALLVELGANHAALRLARTAEPEERSALADRLGIALTVPRPDPATTPGDELDRLLLEPQLASPDARALTEQSLEELLGLPDTTRYPLTDGITYGDAQVQIVRWNLDNVEWGVNTDREGLIHVSLVQSVAGKFRVELYRAAARTAADLVALGERDTSSGPVSIVPADYGELSGRFELAYGADTANIALLALPTLASGRLRRLRRVWREQDRPSNPYADLPEAWSAGASVPRLPIIDPDLIGPDDFRYPYAKLQANDPDLAFDVWVRRRRWVDEQVAALDDLKKQLPSGLLVPDFEAMLDSMYQPLEYAGIQVAPWPLAVPPRDFDGIAEALTRGDERQKLDESRRTIEDDLRLSVESFARLMGIRGKEERNESVTDEEWQELRSILTQARKIAHFPNWIDEEQDVRLGPDSFWVSLRQPAEGAWPPRAPATGRPWIDPEWTKVDELPEPSAGRKAIALWNQRREELLELKTTLTELHKANGINTEAGLDAILGLAFGDPLPDFAATQRDLDSGDAGRADHAKRVLADELHLTVEDFDRLMAMIAKHDAALNAQRVLPTVAEWREIYRLLASAHKARQLYVLWMQQEQLTLEEPSFAGGELAYFRAAKASLPPWRAAVEARQLWQQALRTRGSPPIIDPDRLVPAADFRAPSSGPVYELWSARRAWIAGRLTVLENRRTAAATVLAGVDAMLLGSLFGPLAAEAPELLIEGVVGLEQENQQGKDIEPQLEQLSLTMEGFTYLLRVRKLVDRGALVAESEWHTLADILVQVEKRRSFASWRDAEREQGISLSPEHFKLADLDTTVFPPQPAVVLRDYSSVPWRATEDARRDWQDTLRTRYDQHQAVLDGLRRAIGAVEEATLPALRDALLNALPGLPVGGLEARAKWISSRLLIDAKDEGCQLTTHVAQAIETVQGLLFGIRTGQLGEARPNLSLDADNFEEEWEWIGSYATWRAAMFVFLYPENILLPSFRKRKTPAFSKLIGDLRSNRNLTPERACAAAREYSEYFRDVCNLDLQATCQAKTRVYDGGGCDRVEKRYAQLLHLFARARQNQRAYWSSYDPSLQPPDYAQSFWEEVSGLKGASVTSVLGAVAYRVSNDQRSVFLFAQVEENAKQKLVFVRYDLEQQRWRDLEAKALDLPTEGDREATSFTAVVKQQDQDVSVPHILLRLPSGALYSGRLDTAGDALAKEGWQLLVGPSLGKSFKRLLAAVEIDSNEFYVLVQSSRFPLLRYRLFGVAGQSRDDGLWRFLNFIGDDSGPSQFNPFVGAFRWPGTSEVFVLGNRMLQRSDAPVGHTSVSAVAQFDDWLLRTSGVSLNELQVPTGVQDEKGNSYEGWDLLSLLGSVVKLGVKLAAIAKLEDYWTDEKHAEWNLANEMVTRCSEGRALADVLGALSAGDPVDFRARDDSQEVATVSTTTTATKLAPACWDGNSDESTFELAVHVGTSIKTAKLFGYTWKKGINRGIYRCRFSRKFDDTNIGEVATQRVAPSVGVAMVKAIGSSDPHGITHRPSPWRSIDAADAFAATEGSPRSNFTYLEESYYFVAIHLALQLQERGHYTEALDWFRTVYEYNAPLNRRKLYPGLLREESIAAVYEHAEQWLSDPLDPHQVAETRRNSYTRFTLLSIVRCMFAFADAEFTRDTAESLPRARMLYSTALELLNAPELDQRLGMCADVVGEFSMAIGASLGSAKTEELGVVSLLGKSLSALSSVEELRSLAGPLTAIVSSAQPWEVRLDRAKNLILESRSRASAAPLLASIVTDRRAALAEAQSTLLRLPIVASAAERVGETAGRDYLQAVSTVSGLAATTLEEIEHKAELPWLREVTVATIRDHAVTPLASVELVRSLHTYSPTPSFHFCIPPNPVLKALRFHAEVNLHKIRTCRNIAGMERQLEPYAAATDTFTGLPSIGAGGNLILPGIAVLRPTPYRYATLVERAKQLVQLATQVEAAMLSAFERRDAEEYSALRARQDLRLARAGVRLQDLRVKEAQETVTLAELQEERAQLQANRYQEWIDQGLNNYEIAAVVFWSLAMAHEVTAGLLNFVGAQYAAGTSSMGQASSTGAQIASFYASHERRKQEWEFQRDIAQQDVRIGAHQVRIGNDHVRVTEQERVIAGLQGEHAEATVDFLSNKFTNVELFGWMSGVLEGVYSYFLQQATAMARLAEGQLGFERQEPPPAFIQADYWDAPSNELSIGTAAHGPERRGLTGSARLLQDIYQLDQHAFDTNKRKLQLTKTISLAQLAPVEFQDFRSTGVMAFETPMPMFDRDFPGHYLRLIKRVRVSVVALIPPAQGVRATLSNLGVSRVVIGPELFQSIVVRRPPETVAISSPRDATGLFELTPQNEAEMLLPFEGLGVDGRWELRMPRPANLFDYTTIADVLVSIDYTALNSFDYYQQVIQSPALTRPLSLERPFSFRHHFADQWFDLRNPDQTTTPMSVRFSTRREDFASNLEKVTVQHLAVYLTGAKGTPFSVPEVTLRFREAGGQGFIGGAAAPTDGVVSTRAGNAGTWFGMQGRPPIGEWELAFPDTGDLRRRFKSEEIEDVLFVITHSGRTPPWPS